MFVRCEIQNCGYCSENGFCLNRVITIRADGICGYLKKSGWNEPVEDRFKNNYTPREPVQSGNELVPEIKEKNNYELLGVCDW